MKRFITFEGGDGAGKSTLIEEITKTLKSRGLDVLQTRAPGGTEVGKILREIILHSKTPIAKKTELFLYLADRSEHVEKVILPALNQGKVVLCDRYNDSTIAYQGGARGFGLELVGSYAKFATSNLEPTLTLYLDVDPEIGLKRTGDSKDLIEAEDLSFHQTIRKTFHQLAKNSPRIQIIDSSQSKEIVFEQALKLIDAYIFSTTS